MSTTRANTACNHLHHVQVTQLIESVDGCGECLKTGDPWLHLRMCLECGEVGCCDSSPNRHATRHFQHTHHPVMTSFEPDERWAWCFADEEAVAVPEEALPYLR